MKKLGAIIEECKDGGRPEYDELRYAVLALDGLLFFANRDVKRLYDRPRNPLNELLFKDNYTRMHNALNKAPKEWSGPEHDPDQPEVQKRRRIHQKVFDHVLKK